VTITYPQEILKMCEVIQKYIKNDSGAYVCPHCPKVCEKQNTMYYHIKKNHEQDLPFECTDCNQKFLQRTSFLHHLATIHPDKPTVGNEANPYAGVSYDCPFCDHSTHTKANTLIHVARVHFKSWIPAFSKTESCKCCQKSFASSSAYLYHSITCFKGIVPQETYEKIHMVSVGQK